MKFKIQRAGMIFCTLFMMSCNDYLDQSPVGVFYDEEVFGNLNGINAYVTQRYSEINHCLYRWGTRFACDEAWNNFNWDGTNSIQRGQMTPDFNGNLGTWDGYYKAIRGCNIFMQNLERIESLRIDDYSNRRVDQYIGEITYLRAFFYADLISRYGGVPLITSVFSIQTSPEEMLVPRDSYEDCVNFIVTELDKAIEILPVYQNDVSFGRATKGAAMALKARVLLYAASPFWNPSNDKSKWEKAKDAAYAVLNLCEDGSVNAAGAKVYSLDPDYRSLFLNHRSKEIIFQRLFSTDYGHYFDWYNSPNGYGGYSETCVSQSMVDSYEMIDGSMPDPDALYGKDAGKTYEVGVSPYDGREPRFYASIACDGQMLRGREIEYFDGGRDSGSGGIEEWNVSTTGYYVRKFMNENLRNQWNDKSNSPWIYMRLGEVYLNYAEALYQLGKEDSVRFCLETIRERARAGRPDVLPEIKAGGQELWSKIQQERKIELAFEEHRFFDVRRWRIADITENAPLKGMIVTRDKQTLRKTYKLKTVEQSRKFYEQHYLLPIPRYEMERNSKFVQNPKYN